MNNCDVIVIGSGAGGAAAAHRLVEAGLRVLMLEKGAPLPRDGRTLDIERVVREGEFLAREPWVDGSGKRVVPEEHFNVGGKTKWYGAALLRFGAHEFRSDAEHRCRSWPFPYEVLESYYGVAESLLGVRRFMPEPDLARILEQLRRRAPRWQSSPMPMALDPRIVDHPHEARHFDGFASVQDLKHDAQLALLDPLMGSSHFHLRAGMEVAALLPDVSDPTRIGGVRTNSGEIFRAPRVVLAAGALHSPRLLARFVKQQRLADRLPGAAHIGANLKLHLLTAMVSIGLSRQTDLLRKTAFLTHEDFPHSSVQPLGFDAELISTLIPKFTPRPIARALAARAYGFFLQTEDSSLPENRVSEVEVDGIARRVMDYDERRSALALTEHRAFTRAFSRALLATGRVSFTQRIGIQGTAHVCGSLIAGNDPKDSVVDARVGDDKDTQRLNRPANMVVDPATRELIVADGYGNHRVIVFDADTGSYKRHWGANGRPPGDPSVKGFANPVHCVRLSRDGLIYVCDRMNNRIQVFRKDGTFVREFIVAPQTRGNGSTWDLDLSTDSAQTHLYTADGENNQVWLLLRESGQTLGSFGRNGRSAGQFHWVHNMAVDSVGNIYTTEVDSGKRAQKFVLKSR